MGNNKINIQAVKGMPDILPEEVAYWQALEAAIRRISFNFGYHEIRFPIVEKTDLFKRSIGEVTDIVSKEMFSFLDNNGVSLSLRPEGTAACVRAGLQHGLIRPHLEQRLWYMGPMFRYERPQEGRYRQFNQYGVEAFGVDNVGIEIEQLLMVKQLLDLLDLTNVNLQINNIGDHDTRVNYKKALVAYLIKNYDYLDEESKRRLHVNPLRILDSKDSKVQPILNEAPSILEYLDTDAAKQFELIERQLRKLGIKCEINHKLVRGLDYYNGLVYEWISPDLGAQAAMCGGGRYDKLVQDLGGEPSSAVGFSVGLERVILLLKKQKKQYEMPLDIFFMTQGELARELSFTIVSDLRTKFSDIRILHNFDDVSFKKMFKKADKSQAKIALLMGDDEIANNSITIKPLRVDVKQVTVPIEQLFTVLQEILYASPTN